MIQLNIGKMQLCFPQKEQFIKYLDTKLLEFSGGNWDEGGTVTVTLEGKISTSPEGHAIQVTKDEAKKVENESESK